MGLVVTSVARIPRTPASRRTKAWWCEPSEALRRFCIGGPRSHDCDWYQIVDAFLGLDSEDICLRLRFADLYGEFRTSSAPAFNYPRKLRCRVQVSEEGPVLVTFSAPEQVNIVDFILALFRGRGYVETQPCADDWRSISVTGEPDPLLSAKGPYVLVDGLKPWQPLIASCAINWVMWMQQELLFFHAATVGIDSAGVLITGDKGAGKTTLATTLAASGHAFFGDEIAAVRSRTLELVPFRRSISFRSGARSVRVQQLLEHRRYPAERFPDGRTRIRARPADLFPESLTYPVPLRTLIVLEGFAEQAQAEAFAPGVADLRLLTPLPCRFWGTSPAPILLQVAKLFSSVKCYHLRSGAPEETALLVEGIVRAN